jgi:hypothetical protein
LAEGMLIGSGNPLTLRLARGFYPAEPSGQISEVHWSQDKLLTTAYVQNWFAPAGALGDTRQLAELEDAEAYPHQAATEADRKALGASGAAQNVTPVQPGPSDTPQSTANGAAKVSDLFAQNVGFYVGAELSGTADQAAADTKAGSKKSLAMPEGQAVAGSDQPSILYNVMEDGHTGAHILRAGAYAPILRTGFDKDRKANIALFGMASLEHLFWVDLVQDGGQDAQWSGGTFVSERTWTYKATVAFCNQVLGEKLTPVIRNFRKCTGTAATMGIGCFLGPTFSLVYTNEKDDESPCT